MSNILKDPTISMYAFGIYLFAVGIILFFIPNTLLSLLGLETTEEPWVNIIGVIAFVLSVYYMASAKANVVEFYRFTLVGRLVFVVGILFLVVMQMADNILLLFAGIEFLSLVWTYLALKFSNT